MKIHRLEYYDSEYEWKLEPVELLPNLNLLGGISGAGKTRILQSINSLKQIANGESFNGVEWSVCFSTSKNVNFLVEGNSTEKKIYPQWLRHLVPELTRVKYHDQISKNNYYLISGEGYPRILSHGLDNAVDKIQDFLNFCHKIQIKIRLSSLRKWE